MTLRNLAAAIIAPLALLAAPAANAGEFTIFIYETQADIDLRKGSSPETQAYWSAYGEFAAQIGAAGAMRGGAPLMDPAAAHTLSAGKQTVGAYAQEALLLGGYFQIEAPTLDDALRLAGKAPALARGGAIEVRENYPAPPMTVR